MVPHHSGNCGSSGMPRTRDTDLRGLGRNDYTKSASPSATFDARVRSIISLRNYSRGFERFVRDKDLRGFCRTDYTIWRSLNHSGTCGLSIMPGTRICAGFCRTDCRIWAALNHLITLAPYPLITLSSYRILRT